MDLLWGILVTQTLTAAAELRVPEQFADGPRTSEEVAAAISAHPPSLYRLLRALAEIGILTQDGERFSLTATGQLLRGDVPGSLRALAIWRGRPWCHNAWASLADSVRSGEPAFPQVFGTNPFAWFGTHPEEGEIFNAAMTSLSGMFADAVAEAYDFSGVTRLVDIAGGEGLLLSKILRANPSMQGVLFELPQVIEGARTLLRDAGLGARCEFVGEDFFATAPAGCDAYLLARILHDWDDAHCVTILRRCREAMVAAGRVLIVEQVLPPSGVSSFAGLMDLQMLVLTSNGRERTEEEFADLLARAGLALRRVVPTRSRYSVLEAFRA